MPLNVLSFTEREGQARNCTVIWKEYAIDGVPLAKWMTPPRGSSPITRRYFSPFGFLSSEFESEYAGMLIGLEKSPLNSGRVPLYVCSECGDLGCGAITTEVAQEDALRRIAFVPES